ncbi:MAG: hypothetical protein ABI723_03875 [Bacteroidia bacterium]
MFASIGCLISSSEIVINETANVTGFPAFVFQKIVMMCAFIK